MGQARKGMSVKGDRTETSTWNMGGGVRVWVCWEGC